MNLIRVISNEEPIGGLDIGDDSLRFSLLKRERAGLSLISLAEEKLGPKEGLNNKAVFLTKLTKFVRANKIKYVIASIPSDNIFIKTYSFPSAMPDEKIADAMELTIDLRLPLKREEIYCDWMKIDEANQKIILLSYIKKTQANDLISLLKKANLKIVAVESRAMSLARAVKLDKDGAILVVEKGIVNVSLSVILNNNILFLQSIPDEKIEANLIKEINKIINYHDWLNISINYYIVIGSLPEKLLKKISLKILEPKSAIDIKPVPKEVKWYVSLGSAYRGLIPRKEDKIISLMEMSTEKAYKLEKANSLASFFLSISIALSIFFVAIFLAAWSLVFNMRNNYDRQILSFNLNPSSANAALLREKANSFNYLVDQIGSLVKNEAHWSKVVEEAKNKSVDGVIINNMSLPSTEGVFTLTGVANDRETVNQLKQSFESSAMFSRVEIPLTNLGKKNEIPFSMSFNLKNGEIIYSQ